jgi:hypothetical protein
MLRSLSFTSEKVFKVNPGRCLLGNSGVIMVMFVHLVDDHRGCPIDKQL